MVANCGAIIWYTNFPTHMKNRHKEIPENRHIRLMWGRLVLEDGSLVPYTPPRRSAGVQSQYALPPSNPIGQNVSSNDDDQTTNEVTTRDDEDDLMHDIMCGERDILAPILMSQGDTEGVANPAQSFDTNAAVNDEEETKEETNNHDEEETKEEANHQDVESPVRPPRQKKRRTSAERVAKMVRMLS
ncbi:hypothetical protein AC1031_005159 [Aphanomyces cochlioides]|nr:hypothetical protein AC1031_005159 [Aphanomyces cochlioides]